jgi:hypothetical protein
MQEREKRQHLAFRIGSKRVFPAKMRFFCVIGGFVCAAGFGKGGACFDARRVRAEGKGQIGGAGESRYIFGGGKVKKNFGFWQKKYAFR